MALTKVEAEQLQPAQTSITSVGTLTSLTVGGSTGVNIVADANPVIKFDRGSANTANANLYYNGTLTGQISAANANFQISAAGSSTPMSFYVNGSERMRLLTNGSAVIGGGNSFAQQGGGLLTLEGPDANMLVLHRTADTGDQEIQFYDHGDFNSAIAGKTGGALEFRTNGNSTIAMHITSVGNVGIGTTPDSDVKLHIKGDGARLYVDSADYNLFSIGRRSSSGAGLDQAYLRMKSAGTNTVVLDTAGDTYFNGGNVGIGTSNPNFLLDISGANNSQLRLLGTDTNPTTIVMDYNSGGATGRVRIQNDAGDMKLTTSNGQVRQTILENGNVGIGTTSPSRQLTVSTSGAALLLLESTGDDNGQLLFGDSSSDTVGKVLYRHSDNRMSFQTAGVEHVHIDSSGNVGIDTTSPGSKLDVAGTVRSTAQVGYRHIAHVTQSGNSAPHSFQIGRWPSSGNRWLMVPNPEGSPLYSKEHGYSFTNSRWFTEGDFAVNSGNVVFTSGNGINFSATGDGHSTSNRSELLDDYEEGDWTPIIGGSSGQSGQSYNLQNGKYTKIGSFVNCTFDVQLSAQGSFSGTYVVLRNLPFAPVGNNLGGSANFGYISGWSNITYPMSAYISGNNVYLMEGLSDYIRVNEYKHGNSSRLIGSIIYHTAS